MTRYLISFAEPAAEVTDHDLQEVADRASALVAEMREAGVYVVSGRLDPAVGGIEVDGDGVVSRDVPTSTPGADDGFAVIDVATNTEAIRWAARIAEAWRRRQRVRRILPSLGR